MHFHPQVPTVGAGAASNTVNSESMRVQNITQKLGNTNPSDVRKNKRRTVDTKTAIIQENGRIFASKCAADFILKLM